MSLSNSQTPISRRSAITLFALLPLTAVFPKPSHARRKPRKPLTAALIPIVRVRDGLPDLLTSLESGTYSNVRDVMKTLIIGNKLDENLRDASLWIQDEKSEMEVMTRGREAIEYLDQVVMYFDPMQIKSKPSSEYLQFVGKAINAARGQLDEALKYFEPGELQKARVQLTADVTSVDLQDMSQK